MSLLFEPFNLAGLELPNRIVMAPMTRSRAVDEYPDDLTVLYYKQRAGAGLIISEGAPISREGCGYLFNPGLYTKEQAAGWSKVTTAVHEAGGRIFAQLWHVGRMSHTSLQPNGQLPVSSVAVQARNSNAYAYDGHGQPNRVQASVPRALDTAEMPRITADFVRAAKMAIDSGFDGVEIHGANGYLFEQFINGALNHRNDRYGRSITNRLRFLLETVDAVSGQVGANRLGVRIAPYGRLFDMSPYADEEATWIALANEFQNRPLAYVHLSDQLTLGAEQMPEGFAERFRKAYRRTLIAAGGFTLESGEIALEAGELDLIAFGRPFIANPDLVERMINGWPLAIPDRDTFYGNIGSVGYTDYPTYDPSPTENIVV